MVLPVPLGDHPPVPSPLVARTCTSYLVAASRPVIVAVVSVPVWSWLLQSVPVSLSQLPAAGQ